MPKPPAFWSSPGHPLGLLLGPIGALVGQVSARRMGRVPDYRSSMPVVCVGNLVAGGQGKTPLALALATRLRERGRDPVFLSRGYGGRLAGPLVVTEAHEPVEVGDEPLLLARAAPCIVARDRVAGARLAESLGLASPVLVLDDGFQNPSLAKTFSIIAIDAGYGLGNGQVLPAGPLRAPLARQLAKADALVTIGEGRAADDLVAAADRLGRPVLPAALMPRPDKALEARPVVAYAGIGRPQKFFDTLTALDADIRAVRAFPDHHVYTDEDARTLLRLAERECAALVTTEKDAARLAGARTSDLGGLRAKSSVLPVALVFEDPDALTRVLETFGL